MKKIISKLAREQKSLTTPVLYFQKYYAVKLGFNQH